MSRFSHSNPRNGTFAWSECKDYGVWKKDGKYYIVTDPAVTPENSKFKRLDFPLHQEDDFNFVRGLAWAITFCAVLTTAFILVMLWGGFWA